MKKIFYTIIALGVLIGVPVFAKTIMVSPGDTLSKIAVSVNTTWQNLWRLNPQIKNPDFIRVGQSITFEDNPDGDILGAGYSPITGYQSRTTSFISSSAATIPVVSTKDKAGNQIVLSNISASGTVKVYMNLEPGTSKEEPIVCTGVTATSWTNCTRGLSFQGASETSSSTIATSHNAGAPLIITNISQFFNQYVATDGNQQVNGIITFIQSPQVPTPGSGETNSAASVGYVNGVTINGAPTSSFGAMGLVQLGNQLQIASSTASSTTGAPLVVPTKFTTSSPYKKDFGLVPASDNLGYISSNFINTSTNYMWTASTTFSGGVYMNTATTTFATTTQLGATVVSSTNIFANNLTVNGVSGNSLFTNSTTPSISTYFPMQCDVESVGYSSGDVVAAGANFSFTHSLGVRPSTASFVFMAAMPTGNAWSQGQWVSSTNFTSQFTSYSNNAQGTVDNAVSATVIRLINSDNTVESSATMNTPTNTTQINITVGTNVNTSPNAARRGILTVCK